MTSDQQLHYAALAGGYQLEWVDGVPHGRNSAGVSAPWNSLEHDGDCQRLAAHLCMNVTHSPGHRFTMVSKYPYSAVMNWDDYPCLQFDALRAAVTDVAAQMGVVMSYIPKTEGANG